MNERTALVLTPVLALATVAVGLRVGASARVEGARVYATSAGTGRPGIALRLVTVAEEGGVPELMAQPGLSVTARGEGHDVEWRGASNSEGVAEAWLDVPSQRPDVVVRTAEGALLAEGSLALPAPAAPPADTVAHTTEVRPTQRTGALRVEVFVYGGRLVPGAPTRVAVRVRDVLTGKPVPGARVTIDAEPGLTPLQPFSLTSDEGWSLASVRADFLVVAWKLDVDTSAGLSGSWGGALPVSPGGDSVSLPLVLDAETPYPVRFSVPVASKRLYVDITDAHGRDFGAALDVAAGTGAAATEIPTLQPGLYWLVTSSDPRGAETLTGSTVARPFRVACASSSRSTDERELPTLVELPPPSLSRTMVLDGLRAPKERAARARRRGLAIALGALGIGGALELFLLARASARARRRMLALTDAALLAQPDGEAMSSETAGAAAARVVIVGLLTLLGFALLAALLLVRGG